MDAKEFAVLESGNTSVVLAAIATAVLAIIGLAGILPIIMVSAAAIAIGVSLVLAGIAEAAEKRKILGETEGGKLISSGMFAFSLSVQTLAGITSVVLGILSLLKIAPEILLGADAIVLGIAFIAMCISEARENEKKLSGEVTNKHRVSYMTTKAAIDLQFLVGLGVVTLGILAIIGIAPIILILVAFLAGGVSLAFSGSALDVRLYEEKKIDSK